MIPIITKAHGPVPAIGPSCLHVDLLSKHGGHGRFQPHRIGHPPYPLGRRRQARKSIIYALGAGGGIRTLTGARPGGF